MTRQQEEEESNTIDVINISGSTAMFELDGTKYKLRPLQITTINKAYATPRTLSPGRDPVASSLELLTDKRVLPVTDPRARPAVTSREAQLKAGSAV